MISGDWKKFIPATNPGEIVASNLNPICWPAEEKLSEKLMLFKNNYKNFNSSWINKIDSGENPNSQDLLDHLDLIHDRHAGFTEKIATSCCDVNGKNSYELLLDTIDPSSHKYSGFSMWQWSSIRVL